MMFASVIRSIPPPERKWFWLSCALLVKGLLFWHMMGQPFASSSRPGTMAICSGDCESYLRPIDHLIEHGTYAPDFRMPGYGAVYFVLRCFLSPDTALTGVTLLQLAAGVVACWVLAWGVYRLSGSRHAFLASFALVTLGCAVSDFDRFILSESLSASLLVLAFGAAMEYLATDRPWWLVLAGLCLVWAYFMRPVLFPICLLSLLVAGFVFVRRRKWLPLFLFAAPILVIQGCWSVRNHGLKGKWYLLTESRYYPEYAPVALAGWEFVSLFDDFKALHFYPDPAWKNRAEGEAVFSGLAFPSDITTPDFDTDSLLLLRERVLDWQFAPMAEAERSALEQGIIGTMRRYAKSIEEQHPFIAHIRTPARLATRHIFRSSGAQNLFMAPFSSLSWPQRLVKSCFIAVYLIALYGAILFAIRAVRHARSRPLELMLAAMLVYGLLVHPVVIRTADVRYLYVFYPLMCICSGLFIGRILGGRGRAVSTETPILAP